ncbi:MAG: carboxymuconolactone decarboxylase family protein [Candidatus Omnitrophica bacterium]|nr:carboxymuconolactone decarboxylase family protein [Candidatus Omnitrophota bacterium]
MSHLNPITYEEAQPEVKELFDALKKKMKMVPNIYATVANSPTVLKALLQFGENLKQGEFSHKEVEAIALAVSEENHCEYCLSAHTAVGKMVGFSEEETRNLRLAKSDDQKLQTLTALAKEIVHTKGYPSESTINEFFSAGYSKRALVDLIGFVALNVFTNYFNHIAQTKIDFPEAQSLVNR